MNPQTPPLETPLPRTMPGRVVLPTALLLLASLGSSADQFVTTCDQPSLLSALQAGGTIKLACDGTILLTQTLVIDKDTVLDASGHQVVISGEQSHRVFLVKPGVKFSLLSLTVAEGRSDKGGGLFNEGAEVTVLNCTFLRNAASGAQGTNGGGAGADALGGAVYTLGTFLASNCTFKANLAKGGAGGSCTNSGGVVGPGGGGGAAFGGAVYAASGSSQLTDCTLVENETHGGTGGCGSMEGFMRSGYAGGAGGVAWGGALYLAGGSLDLMRCRASRNQAVGGTGGSGGSGGGGGAAHGGGGCSAGRVGIAQSTFDGNHALAGAGRAGGGTNEKGWPTTAGGAGGNAEGGAWFSTSTLLLDDCTLVDNQASGGSGGAAFLHPELALRAGSGGAGSGGALWLAGGSLDMLRCRVSGNAAGGGPGGGGGDAAGGIARGGGGGGTGEVRITQSTFDGNRAFGGDGLRGRDGYSFWMGTMAVYAPGFDGGGGGAGQGGAWFNAGRLVMQSSTVSAGQAAGGHGGQGGLGIGGYSTPMGFSVSNPGNGGAGGAGEGGGLYNHGAASLRNATFAANVVSAGRGGDAGIGTGTITVQGSFGGPIWYADTPDGEPGQTGGAAGGAISKEMGEVALANTILAASSGADNASGTLTDQGHNLSSDASCAFTATGSLNNADPKLLPLADNGGPTPTMALAPDSPARDQGDSALAGAADQRGVPRPIGPGSDIGAFEFVPPFSITPLPDGAMRLSFTLQPGRTAVLQATTDLRTWTDRQTSQTDTAGLFTAIDTEAPRHPRQFYRTKTP